jgi:CubicO group peptidase (beta-lactamase class C family)
MFDLKSYFNNFPVTSFMIARKNKIFVEHYLHERNNKHRFQSWSMAKSVTSLLLGVCLDLKWIESIDDTVEKYVSELTGTLHGKCTIRNLGNMSSGAQVEHMSKDYDYLYPMCFSFPENTDILPVIAKWNNYSSNNPPGKSFNYNELCALAIGILIRKVSNMTLSKLFEQYIYQPMGGESMATWSTDSKGNEFNCIGLAMTTRDWCRLGMLIAGKGFVNKKQIISKTFMEEITSWDMSKEKQVLWSKGKHVNNTALQEQGILGCGYKLFFWHQKIDGSQPTLSGQ